MIKTKAKYSAHVCEISIYAKYTYYLRTAFVKSPHRMHKVNKKNFLNRRNIY